MNCILMSSSTIVFSNHYMKTLAMRQCLYPLLNGARVGTSAIGPCTCGRRLGTFDSYIRPATNHTAMLAGLAHYLGSRRRIRPHFNPYAVSNLFTILAHYLLTLGSPDRSVLYASTTLSNKTTTMSRDVFFGILRYRNPTVSPEQFSTVAQYDTVLIHPLRRTSRTRNDF